MLYMSEAENNYAHYFLNYFSRQILETLCNIPADASQAHDRYAPFSTDTLRFWNAPRSRCGWREMVTYNKQVPFWIDILYCR